jgi:hypothetical protein
VSVQAVAGNHPGLPKRRVVVERSESFDVTGFDIADDESVMLWDGGELVGWFRQGTGVRAVYFADTAAQAG